jgi:hypothetical protein
MPSDVFGKDHCMTGLNVSKNLGSTLNYGLAPSRVRYVSVETLVNIWAQVGQVTNTNNDLEFPPSVTSSPLS